MDATNTTHSAQTSITDQIIEDFLSALKEKDGFTDSMIDEIKTLSIGNRLNNEKAVVKIINPSK